MNLQALLELVEIDVRSLIGILFWGSLTSFVLMLSYVLSNRELQQQRLGKLFLAAKLCLSAAYFLLFYRGILPDLFSVNIGNTLLIVGFYFESLALCDIVGVRGKVVYSLSFLSVAVSIFLFNAIELLGNDPTLRVAIASICVFIVLLIPSLALIFSKKVTPFKRFIGAFYLFFILLLLPRAFYSVFHPSVLLFTTSLIQSLTFLSMVMLTMFSLSAFLMLMKEDADRAITVMATKDFLTGLSNRYSFLEEAELTFAKNKKTQTDVSVIFFDIDHFKKVNDTYGHAFGDIVLARFASILCQHMRNTDMICRYGGEEFLVFLSNSSAVSALMIAERILDTARADRFDDNPEFKFTVSAGLMADIPTENDTLQAWIDRADQALYHSKNTGRDRITEYSQIEAFMKSTLAQ